MASYTASLWDTARFKLEDMMLKPEYKYKPSAALSVFRKNTDFLIPSSEREAAWGNTKPSDSVTTNHYFINKQDFTVASAREYNHSGSIGDSTETTISWTTYKVDFLYSLKRADRNIFNQAEMLAQQIRAAAIDLHADIESDLMTSLNTNKSQVVVDTSPQSGDWDSTNYIFGVLNADEAEYFQYLKMFMAEQYYRGNFDVINNIKAQAKANYLGQQGQGNATNLGWQIDGMNMVMSTELSNATGYLAMSYIIPEGTIGILDWIPRLNRQGFGDTFQNGGRYATIPDPLGSGLTFAVHEYAEGADNDSAGSETQDVNVEVELSVDLAEVYAPMSTANASPVFKCGLKS